MMTTYRPGNGSEPILRAEGLRKQYKETTALDGLDLIAESGRLTALLGPNGAGKTTFVSAVATLLKPDSGSLHVGGIDAIANPGAVRRVIGLAGQYASVEQAMTGTENLTMVARLFGLNRSDAATAAKRVLARLGLSDDGDRLVRTYSGGMRRRLDLGASLVGSPHLLLLDEPTTGLDPRSRQELWEAIRELVSEGTDVLLTTQYLEEADQLARDVVIIDHGRVIAAGTPPELKSQVGRDIVEVHPLSAADIDAVARILASVSSDEVRIDRENRRVTIGVTEAAQLGAAVRMITDARIQVDDIGLRRPTLDEVFLTMTGQPAAIPAAAPDSTLEGARS
jgi:daunorubicin resistance ABC transporter ATP-binding subunit